MDEFWKRFAGRQKKILPCYTVFSSSGMIVPSLKDVEESSHMGSPDFRVWGQNLRPPRFESQGYGDLMLTSEQQAMLVEEQPGMFLPMAAAA